MAVYNQTYNINNQCGMGSMNFGQGLLYGMLGSITGMVGGGSYMGMNGSLFNMGGLGNMYGSPASFFGMGGYGCCGGMSGYSDSYYASMAGMSVANVVLGGVFSAIGSYRTERAEAKEAVATAKSDVKTLTKEIEELQDINKELNYTSGNVSSLTGLDASGKVLPKAKSLCKTQASAYETAVYNYNLYEADLCDGFKVTSATKRLYNRIPKTNNQIDKTSEEYKTFLKNAQTDNSKFEEVESAKVQAEKDLASAVQAEVNKNLQAIKDKQAKLDEANEIIDGAKSSSKSNSTESAQSSAERQAMKLAEKQQRAEQREIEKKEEEARKAADQKTKEAWEPLKKYLKQYNSCNPKEKAQIGNKIKNYIKNNEVLNNNANAQKIIEQLKLTD